MMFSRKNKQEAGDKSTNFQGQNINIHQGITYLDAKEIALDVYKANFLELSERAGLLAMRRVEEITDSFLNKLNAENPEYINSIEDPDMQYAIFTAQNGYARSGEKELEKLLVNILVERAKDNSQSLRKIVLNESLKISLMLTSQQLDTLSIVFLIRDLVNDNITDKLSLKKHLLEYYIPFIGNLTSEQSHYRHLIFTGCCSSASLHQNMLSIYFKANYNKVLCKGLKESSFDSFKAIYPEWSHLVIPCLNDKNLFQLDILDRADLKYKAKDSESSLYHTLYSLNNSCIMDNEEVNVFIEELMPGFLSLSNIWRDSLISTMNLTSVGIALACININQKIDAKIDISTWIR